MFPGMGRDRTRVLLCAAVSLVLILAATLTMDWYLRVFEVGDEVSRVSIDLTSVRTCTTIHICTTTPLGPPGMFSTLATVTMWSSLAFAALVAYQAGARLLTGDANDTIARLGYMFALTTLSIAVATAYMFGAETDGPGVQIAAHMGVELQRTWAPLTLIIGIIGGFATLYMSVAPDSTDLGDTYKPVTMVNLRAPTGSADPADRPGAARGGAARGGAARGGAARGVTGSMQIPAAARAATRPLRPSGRTGILPPTSDTPTRPADPALAQFAAIASRSHEQTQPGTMAGAVRNSLDTRSTTESPPTLVRSPPTGRNPVLPAAGVKPSSGPIPRPLGTGTNNPVAGPSSPARDGSGVSGAAGVGAQRPASGQSGPLRRPTPSPGRPITGQYPLPRRAPTEAPGAHRLTTGQGPAAVPSTTGRVPVIGPATITSQVPLIEPTPTGQGAAALSKSGPIAIPEHLRKRLSYVAVTAELTVGGIDARREDGTSRLVLWRDVVGVVVRRMPPVFDNALFVDIVSTARSTLRILPWTRLAGDPINGEGEGRPARIIEYILARCPKAKLDPATRQFIDTGEPAQIPDLETLRAHDARLA
jgi:hypothetical protein